MLSPVNSNAPNLTALATLAQRGLMQEIPSAELPGKPRPHLCTQHGKGRAFSMNHSCELSSSAKTLVFFCQPFLIKAHFTTVHSTANYFFSQYSYISMKWPVTTEVNLSSALTDKQQEVKQCTDSTRCLFLPRCFSDYIGFPMQVHGASSRANHRDPQG